MSPHGTHSRYTNDDCRCDPCTAAHTAFLARRRAERYAVTAAQGLPEHVQHGRSAYSNWGCKCEVCRADWAAYARARRVS
jgi:hypothetical protein